MMGYGYGTGAGGWIAMTIFWVALIVLVVWAVSRAFPGTGTRQSETPAPRQETPEELLDRRYAAGELDDETYQSMRATLGSAKSTRR